MIVRALRRGQLMADSRLLQRLIGGRLWIPLVAAGLIGIVFMQVSMLRLNAGISHSVERASLLERDIATLRADVSRMESGERIDRIAAQLGMVVPGSTGDHYVVAGRDDAARAAIRMTSPDPNAVARAQEGAAVSAISAASVTAPAAAATTATAGSGATAATAAGTTPPTASSTQTTAAPSVPSAQPQTSAAPATGATATQAPAPAPAAAASQQSATATAASGGVAAPTPGQA